MRIRVERRVALPAVAFAFICVAAVWGLAQPISEHFVIQHSTGFGAPSPAYVELVQDSLENARVVLLEAGFKMFSEPVQVHIIDSDSGELGAEYLDQDASGNWIPVIEIAGERVMGDALTYAYAPTTLEDLVASTCAHELFHVIQDYHSIIGTGDISEQSFVEAHATAIQDFVVPSANDYLEPSLDFLLAPDSIAFFDRRYDAGIFWVYVIDHYGIQSIRDIMRSSAGYDGRYAVDAAFSIHGETFFDVWSDFAAAMATSSLPDADLISTLVPQSDDSGWWTTTHDPADLPPSVFRAVWTGMPIAATTVNAFNDSEYAPQFQDDEIGTPLRVAHAYGIDILEIVIESTSPMAIEFNGDAESIFRTMVALEDPSGWSLNPFTDSITVTPTEQTSRIRLIITRTEPGTGKYYVKLNTP